MHASTSLYPPDAVNVLRGFRLTLGLFMLAVVVSGLACFALQREVDWLMHWRLLQISGLLETPLGPWLDTVQHALARQSAEAPFLFYATDWLGFAHLAFALAFVGPLLHPARNRWVLEFGALVCLGVIPLALIAGPFRGVPLFWRLAECVVAAVAAIPLLLCRHYLHLMTRLRTTVVRQRRLRSKRHRTKAGARN